MFSLLKPAVVPVPGAAVPVAAPTDGRLPPAVAGADAEQREKGLKALSDVNADLGAALAQKLSANVNALLQKATSMGVSVYEPLYHMLKYAKWNARMEEIKDPLAQYAMYAGAIMELSESLDRRAALQTQQQQQLGGRRRRSATSVKRATSPPRVRKARATSTTPAAKPARAVKRKTV
jgi:hypothetical protein